MKSRIREIDSLNHCIALKSLWLVHRQYCCRGACQISEQSYNSKHIFRNFETLRDLTIRRNLGYWNVAHAFVVVLDHTSWFSFSACCWSEDCSEIPRDLPGAMLPISVCFWMTGLTTVCVTGTQQVQHWFFVVCPRVLERHYHAPITLNLYQACVKVPNGKECIIQWEERHINCEDGS